MGGYTEKLGILSANVHQGAVCSKDRRDQRRSRRLVFPLEQNSRLIPLVDFVANTSKSRMAGMPPI
jgi:hypothetical protein